MSALGFMVTVYEVTRVAVVGKLNDSIRTRTCNTDRTSVDKFDLNGSFNITSLLRVFAVLNHF